MIDWKDIPGYGGRYQATMDGDIRSICPRTGKVHIMTPYHKKMAGSQRLVVKMRKDGRSKEEIVMQIIAKTFLGECPPGYVARHRNGLQSDNSVNNIEYISRVELGKLTGAEANRKPVAKINTAGEVVEFYSSAREAARRNYMSYQTVIDRCNGKVKKSVAPDGYDYIWDGSEVSMRHAMERIRRRNNANND